MRQQTLLKYKELGFNGWVMSDWGATHSTSINQGMDQEMPGGVWFGKRLAAAVAAGNVTVAKIDDSVLRILTPMFAVGQFDTPNPNKGDTNVTSAAHSHMARVLAAQSVVLLQNEVAADGPLPMPALPLAAYMQAAAMAATSSSSSSAAATASRGASVFRIGVLGRHAHTLPVSGGGG